MARDFELDHELVAAIDLDRVHMEQRLLAEVLQKACGADGGGRGIGAHEAQFADRVGGFAAGVHVDHYIADGYDCLFDEVCYHSG